MKVSPSPEPSASNTPSFAATTGSLPAGMWVDCRSLLDPSDQTKVIFVLGLEAIGKSLLAKKAYDRRKAQFDLHARVCMADTIEDVLKDILKQIVVNADVANDSREGLIRRINEQLTNKRYLIVIDGILEADQWTAIVSAFPENKTIHSRIIVTTTKDVVADNSCSLDRRVYRMEVNPSPEPSAANTPRSLPAGMWDYFQSLLDPYDQTKVIFVLGPGGIGKSLLAKRAYDSRKAQFSLHAHVRMADNIEDVLRDILEQIGVNADVANDRREGLIRRIELQLTNKRYLIVIDGIRESNQWTKIASSFPKNYGISSRVIVTSTNQLVAVACDTLDSYVYRMSTLNRTDSSQLFSRNAGREEDDPNVENYARGLLNKCDDLPLALVTVGKYVQETGGLEYCDTACSNLGHFLETEQTLARMQWVLAREFSSLGGSALKARLLYLCTFDSAQEISRNSVIRRWIAEGFLKQEESHQHSTYQSISECINWEKLIDRNIITFTPTDVGNNGKVKKICKLPGMVLEYISHKSFVEKLVASHDQNYDYTRCLLLRDATGGQDLSPYGESYPSTLVVSGTADIGVVLSSPYCKLMRVLDLENCSNQLTKDHLKKICDLLLLRYLSLGAGIEEVPSKIERLRFLETLDLKKTKEKVLVPANVILLPMLKHLLGKFELSHGSDINGTKRRLSNSNLETLAGFVVGSKPGFSQLLLTTDGNPRVVGKLRKVKIWFDSDASDENLTALSKAIKKFIEVGTDNPRVNYSLSIDFQECSEEFIQSTGFNQFLNSLCDAHGGLGSVKICGRGMQHTPILKFVSSDKLTSVRELYLSSTGNLRWNDLICLGKMDALNYLKLEAKVMCRDGEIIIKKEDFKALWRMCLVAGEQLCQIRIEAEALQQLQSLHLICKNLVGGSAEIQHLTKLKEVAIHDEVNVETKESWKTAVRNLPKRPNLVFVKSSSETVPTN